MIVLTIGAVRDLKKIGDYIALEFQKITPKALIPTYEILQKGDIRFLCYKIDDNILAQNYNFFFQRCVKVICKKCSDQCNPLFYSF